ncbi:MAG: M28 family peptidase [Planctomycetes bacterium]|nr:M28 family peptidase [Planctomycetota bacterium]
MESSRHGRARRTSRLGLALLCALLAACDSAPRIPEEFIRSVPPGPKLMAGDHAGPPVTTGDSGPARFVAPLHARFDPARAFEDVRFIDGFYRAPANDGYETVLAHLEARLRAGGFGSTPGFELELLESELQARGWMEDGHVAAQAWTPLGARLSLVGAVGADGTVGADGAEHVLHSFDDAASVDRVMLPVHAPSCDVVGPVALGLEGLDPGEILVTSSAPVASVLKRAHELGALAVVSSYLASYNSDPRGERRELGAIQFSTVPFGTPIPVARISPAAFLAIQSACSTAPGTRLAFRADVRFDSRKLRTLVARVTGSDRPNEAVVVASHVQEPGACDNASGVAGLVESALALAAAIEAGELPRPSRTLVFLWGDEFRQTTAWLDHTTLVPVAGLSSDMTGESHERTGAIALLERMPDPAAICALPPDEHTPWGARAVEPATLAPNGVAIVARCALFDVAAIDGGWQTAEHPYEGGSDHDILIARGIPAALFWHFTDFAYHTSLDRLEHVDSAEMRRTACAILATALALADPRPADLQRYLDTLNEELLVRTRAAAKVEDEALASGWRDWFVGARHWFRTECLRLPPPTSSNP